MPGRHAKVGVSLKASLEIAWFLCGSMWFLQGACVCTCSFGFSNTLNPGVVPAWFHVVPAWINSKYGVSGLHQKLPERFQELVDNEGDRFLGY